MAVTAAILLVFLNGFFVLAEFSIIKIRGTRLEELSQQGDKRADLAIEITTKINSYLSATQLGVTLSSLGLGWLGEPAVAALLQPLIFTYFPGSVIVLHTVTIAVAFTIITFMHIVFGELIPKTIAIQKAESIALLSVWPLYLFHKIGYPVIVLFDATARAVLRVMGLKTAPELNVAHTEEELRMIVSASRRGGVLDQMESDLIDNVFDFADRLAREVMVPRQDMSCLFVEDSYDENMNVVRETAHTRYPLCTEDKDHVLGMIHIRDLMDICWTGNKLQDLRSIMREILMVPEGMSVAKLLQLMRHRRIHLAVVVDEFGGTAGMVALEDVLEEIVGNIQDEHDEPEDPEIQRMQDGTYQFDGKVLLDDIAKILSIRIEEADEDTVGGYIFGILGRQPQIDDQVDIGGYQFKILACEGFRVLRVQAMPPAQDEAPPEPIIL